MNRGIIQLNGLQRVAPACFLHLIYVDYSEQHLMYCHALSRLSA